MKAGLRARGDADFFPICLVVVSLMPRIVFNPLGGSWLFVAILMVATVAVICFVRPQLRGLSSTRRRVLMAIRLLMTPIVAILLTRPEMIRIEKEELPVATAILCDLSESMTIPDSDGSTRYESMRAIVEKSRDSLKKLGENVETLYYGFGESTVELGVNDGVVEFPDAPTERETRLGAALEDVARRNAGKRLLSVLVLSDGAQRVADLSEPTPQEAALRLRGAERRVDVLPIGGTDSSKGALDVSVAELRANDRVFIGNELAVSGRLRAIGLKEREIPLALELETQPGVMTVVAQTTLVPSSDDATIPWRLLCKPATPGEWKLRVSSPVIQGELLDSNNEMSAFVQAIDGGVRTLYVEGTRRYEQKYLRAALDASSDVLVQYWRPPVSSLVTKFPEKTEAQLVEILTKSRKSLGTAFFKEGKYATYILGDADSTTFQPEELAELSKRVEEGAGLVVVVGERALGLGGYAETPLADVFPVEIFSSDRVPLDVDLSHYESAGEEKRRYFRDYLATPTPEALDSRDAFAISLNVDRQKNLEAWRALPPLSSVYRLGRVKRGAATLLRAIPVDAKGEEVPLLVVGRYGLGRVAIVATDSTWRWRMRGHEAEHSKFWRQLILWTAKTDELLEGELAIEMESTRLAPGERPSFDISYRPKEGETLEGTTVVAQIVDPDGARRDADLTRMEETWHGEAAGGSDVGDYQIEASLLSSSGAVLQTARARFLVRDRNLELEDPGADPDSLANLAATTEGCVLTPDALDEYFLKLAEKRETIVDYHEKKTSLYDVWPVFAAFVLLATIEWILRRRWNLA